MVEVLLHLWRASADYLSNNVFMGMVQQGSQADATIHARGNGTFGRFILRILDNTSTSIVTLDFFKNGILQPNSRIKINGVGQIGTFLPISQLPQSFLADDEIVVKLTGINVGGIRGEVSFDLRFTSQATPLD